MFLKRGGSKKGMFSVGMIVAFFVSISIGMLVVFVLLSQMDYTRDSALMSYENIRDEVVVGSDLFYLDAVDGRNGYIENVSGLIRLSDTSGAMRLDKTLIKINTMHGSGVYTFGGLGKENVKLNKNETGTYIGTFTVDFVTKADDGSHNDVTLKTGEVIRLYLMLPTPVYEDEVLEFSLYPHNGRAETKRVVAPDIMLSERILLYP